MSKRIIVGISGASGAPVAVATLEALRELGDIELHLVISRRAEATIAWECSQTIEEIHALADCVHDAYDLGAPIASGSFKTQGMIIVPCSMKSLAGIACGYADNLLLRAADVCLKERRTLILATRETPLNCIHIDNMRTASQAGAVIAPVSLSYYSRPESVTDMTRHMAGKILDLLGLDSSWFKRWEGI